MDRLEAMSILVRVVDAGSFSAASRALGVPLATVSRKVNRLEEHLGTRLLARTTRRLSLTDAGAAYVAAARRILDEVDATERAAAGEFQAPRGELILTAPVFFGRLHVLPLVTDFLAAYPEISIRLLLSDRNLHFVDDHVDLAARIGPLPDSRAVATRVGTMRRVVCAAPALLDRHGTPETPADLARLPCVNFDPLSPAAAWPFHTPAGPVDVTVPTRLTVTTAAAAVQAAARGAGATRVLHYQCVDGLRDGALRLILTDFEPAPLPVHLVHGGAGPVPTKIRAFLAFAAPRLRRRLADLAA